jgi:hypothetical protein
VTPVGHLTRGTATSLELDDEREAALNGDGDGDGLVGRGSVGERVDKSTHRLQSLVFTSPTNVV